MRVIWSKRARRRREEIFDYIAEDNPKAALWLDEQFSQAVDRLVMFPHSGRKGRVSSTREVIIHSNYILVYEYELNFDQIVILTIYHAAQYDSHL